ncbi:MAG: response regulator receiver protein [Candidatus Saccharibacteria bacterium]|nr:response regulator receiver protein [Candidatus Saccharibacteria bacterium]
MDNDQHSTPINQNGLKVLCVEDEFFISELYDRALRKAGYDVTNALNGNDGLELAKTDQYDIILLDLMVPGMTGIEILKVLSDETKTPKIHSKIIITTNLVQDDAARQEIESHADGYIIKADITPKELVAFLEKLR